MELSDRELEQMARFFSKRFPSFEQRVSLASQIGLVGTAQVSGDPYRAWKDLLRLASQAGRLPALTTAAARRRPEDPGLFDLVGSINQGSRARPGWSGLSIPVLAGCAAALVLFGFLLGRFSKDCDEQPSAPAWLEAPQEPIRVESQENPILMEERTPLTGSANAPREPESRAQGTGRARGETPSPGGLTASNVRKSSAESKPRVIREGDLAWLSQISSGEELDSSVRDGTASGRCGGPGGQLLGWWYSPYRAPTAVGELYTVRGPQNVREGNPTPRNRYKVSGKQRCTLKKGDRVLLRAKPVRIPGYGYWVPFYAGDLQVE